jgi:sugar phosphate isomerase/epimerase
MVAWSWKEDMDVAIRDAILAEVDARRVFENLRGLGVAAVEIEVRPDFSTPSVRREDGTPHSVKDAPASGELKRRLSDEGVRVSALLVSTDFASDDAEAHVDWAVRAVEAAAELGAPVVRIDPLARDKSLGAGEVLVAFNRSVYTVLQKTRGLPVDLGVENHGPLANDPHFLDHVFAAAKDDPRLGLTLDTGNFYWFGHPLAEVYRLLQRYGSRTKHTHVKNINYPPELAERRRGVGQDYGKYCCALDEGNLDLKRVVGILRGCGYDRDLCVENESLGKHPPEQKLAVLGRDVRALRAAIGAAQTAGTPKAV